MCDGRLVPEGRVRRVLETEPLCDVAAVADHPAFVEAVAAQLEVLGTKGVFPGASLLLNACSRPEAHAHLLPLTARFGRALWHFNARMLVRLPADACIPAAALVHCQPPEIRAALARICTCDAPGRDLVSQGALCAEACSLAEAHALFSALPWHVLLSLVVRVRGRRVWDAAEARVCDEELLVRWQDFVEAGAHDSQLPLGGPQSADFCRRARAADASEEVFQDSEDEAPAQGAAFAVVGARPAPRRLRRQLPRRGHIRKQPETVDPDREALQQLLQQQLR